MRFNTLKNEQNTVTPVHVLLLLFPHFCSTYFSL